MSDIEIDSVNHHMPLSMHVQTSTKKTKHSLCFALKRKKTLLSTGNASDCVCTVEAEKLLNKKWRKNGNQHKN